MKISITFKRSSEDDIHSSSDVPLSTEIQIRQGSGHSVDEDSGEIDFEVQATGDIFSKNRQYFYHMTPKQSAKFTAHDPYIRGKKWGRWPGGLDVFAPSEDDDDSRVGGRWMD